MLLRKQTAYSQTFAAALDFRPSRPGYEAGVVLWWSHFCHAAVGVSACAGPDGQVSRRLIVRQPIGEAGVIKVRIRSRLRGSRFYAACIWLTGWAGRGISAKLGSGAGSRPGRRTARSLGDRGPARDLPALGVVWRLPRRLRRRRRGTDRPAADRRLLHRCHVRYLLLREGRAGARHGRLQRNLNYDTVKAPQAEKVGSTAELRPLSPGSGRPTDPVVDVERRRASGARTCWLRRPCFGLRLPAPRIRVHDRRWFLNDVSYTALAVRRVGVRPTRLGGNGRRVTMAVEYKTVANPFGVASLDSKNAPRSRGPLTLCELGRRPFLPALLRPVCFYPLQSPTHN